MSRKKISAGLMYDLLALYSPQLQDVLTDSGNETPIMLNRSVTEWMI
jgi:hypothetical protein